MRILSGLLVCLLWGGMVAPGINAQSLAADLNTASKSQSLDEATAFLTDLLKNSANPILAGFARESLQRLQTNQDGDRLLASAEPTVVQTPVKTLAVVALLPQVDKTYVVPAVVNKKYMATFLVDTGASYTVITPQMAESMGIDLNDDLPSVMVTTANGTVQAPLVTLDQVSLGGMKVHDVQAVVADLGDAPQLSGLLGMSFFQGMDISFKQDKLVISR